MLEAPGEGQRYAWRSSIAVLKRCFDAPAGERPSVAGCGLVFEYEPTRRALEAAGVVILC